MCGISGIWHFDRSYRLQIDPLNNMTQALAHRGPDESGLKILKNVGLGSCRLSIIDIKGSSQPLHNEASDLWLTINGEVYNYRQLRSQLLALGHCFETEGDAEVIIHGFEQYGGEFIKQLRGMFAFALWDSRQQIMTIAADAFGEKPLYYLLDQEHLLFASELKAILKYPLSSREIDLDALDEYFTYGCIGAPRSIFKKVRKILPGHYYQIHADGHMEKFCYWKPQFALSTARTNQSIDDLVDPVRALLRQSVQRQLLSDVPIGAFLSGGIDSSCVVAMMSELSQDPIETFSIGFHEQQHDESLFARNVATQFAAHHNLKLLVPDFDDLPRIVRQFDEPHADSTSIATYYLCKLAREYVKVVLSGNGGDEIFGGYRAYLFALQASWNQAELEKSVVGIEEEYRYIKKFPIEECYMYFFRSQRERLFQSGVISRYCGEQFKLSAAEEMKGHDLLTRFQFVDIKCYLTADILTMTDRMSMLNALEVRSPFLDQDLFDFMALIPSEYKCDGTATKILLRRAFEDLLPAHILNRPKQGFSIPLASWLRQELSPLAHETLLSKRLVERGWFNPDYIGYLLDEHEREAEDHSDRLWALICFELWAQEYLD